MGPIAVGGIAQEMPDDFPFSDENAGNMIHGRAPYEMFRGTVDVRRSGWRKYYSAPKPLDFINKQCSHYVFSCANFIQFDNFTERKRNAYTSLQTALEPIEIPLVIFGLGAQAPASGEIDPEGLPEEAIEFMRFLGRKCQLISVRGNFTARVFSELAGVENTVVTGCPSFFQRPSAFSELKQFLRSRRRGGISFNATHFSSKAEQHNIGRAVAENHFWLEVHSPSIHRFYVQSLRDPELAEVPQELRFLLQGVSPKTSRAELVDYIAKRYRLYRDVRPWYQFNRDHVRLSYGTRFHGNMAALLAGRPALWLTHDSRTKELTDTLKLPNIPIEETIGLTSAELEDATDFGPMFEALPDLYSRFNGYLSEYGLPTVDLVS